MRFGVSIPNFGDDLSARAVGNLVVEAENAGWDGFFLWDHMVPFSAGPMPLVDPWIALTAAAMVTRRIRLGPLVTPLPRRRPAMVAREAVTLDHLAGGRLILGVGSGALPYEWEWMGEEPDARVRGAMLDEALDVITGLWSGEPFTYAGAHFRLSGDEAGGWQPRFFPPPVTAPRIPIWVAGTWPGGRPFQRAARWDGVCPMKVEESLSPTEVRDLVAYIARFRQSDAPFDVVIGGQSSGVDRPADSAMVRAYRDVGATWWIEDLNPWRFGWADDGPWPHPEILRRLRLGPPRDAPE